MSDWKQPAPTKAFAIYLDDAWYGEGDTAKAAWADAQQQVSAGHSSYGNAMWGKIRRGGRVVESAPREVTKTEIKALSSAMQEAAAESGRACEQFGKSSAQYISLLAAFKSAVDAYEAACKTAGIEAYATYDID